jgi:rhomboid protease GluP
LNPPSVIAVGASGAIMALLAATLIASAHFPSGAIRTRLWFSSILALIVALLPLLAASFRDQPVDYAAHLGGTLAGLLVSLVMFKVWSRAEPQPGFRRAAMAVAVAGAVALAYPAIAIPRVYRAMAFITQLIPADQVPKSSAEMRSRAASLVAQYPRDPRPRFLRTADMLDANDFTGAEREARAALADEDLWRPILSPQLGNTLRIMLAVAINGDRPEEARETVRPACAAIREGPMRKLLDDRKLCSN